MQYFLYSHRPESSEELSWGRYCLQHTGETSRKSVAITRYKELFNGGLVLYTLNHVN